MFQHDESSNKCERFEAVFYSVYLYLVQVVYFVDSSIYIGDLNHITHPKRRDVITVCDMYVGMSYEIEGSTRVPSSSKLVKSFLADSVIGMMYNM
jgi:hypothetical protein